MKNIRQNLTEQEVEELQMGESIYVTVGDTRVELYQGEECGHICTSNCRREGCNCPCGEFCLRSEDNSPPKTDEEEEFRKNALLGINPLKDVKD